ncbi:methionyl-tRNA formyltransferase [marine gamma proteobacterium HTCC2143]|uniref:Methionyl-tRNA formyltransferase n=1 Tax=marine gamma proteobacterium HTCC2143 TaxID=247633 RepID=A0Y999_9GAMM|nr:methionyl-tRNA formyltransferase [marine gamma proteobacterium HTCC2143]
MAKMLRLIFAGTPDFAAAHLKSILEQGKHEVVAVYSQPDRPSGRGKKLTPSPVKQVALEHNIPVFQPLNFKAVEDQQTLKAINADLMIVAAYGLLLPPVILQTPNYGCINVHASLLPRWRGAAPIQRAIEAGDSESGVVIMQMDEGLDTGDMLLTASCNIENSETGGSLLDKLTALGIRALNQALDRIAEHQISATAQPRQNTTYAAKISKDELTINWQQAATVIERKIRAFNPFPVAYTNLDGRRIKIWLANVVAKDQFDSTQPAGTIVYADRQTIIVNCGDGQLSLQTIQLPGGKALPISAVMNSKAEMFAAGTRFDVIGNP